MLILPVFNIFTDKNINYKNNIEDSGFTTIVQLKMKNDICKQISLKSDSTFNKNPIRDQPAYSI